MSFLQDGPNPVSTLFPGRRCWHNADQRGLTSSVTVTAGNGLRMPTRIKGAAYLIV